MKLEMHIHVINTVAFELVASTKKNAFTLYASLAGAASCLNPMVL
jgi:hypothetical protein